MSGAGSCQVGRLEALEQVLGRPAGRTAVRLLGVAFSLGLVGYLGWQLTAIGWREVLRSVPRTPWFYAAFGAFYLCMPLCECLVWRHLWACPLRRSFPAVMKKRVYSRQVLDYSGEAYLYLWSCRNVGRAPRELLHAIKDNVIVSGLASMLVGAAALAGLLAAGQVALPAQWLHRDAQYGAVAALLALAVAVVAVRYRRRILWLPRRSIGVLFGLHGAKAAAMLLAELAMWVSVNPAVPLRSWLSLLAIDIVVSRVPFLPNRDLVLFGTGLEVAPHLRVALPVMAAMLLTVSILDRALSLLLFGLFTITGEPAPRGTVLAEAQSP